MNVPVAAQQLILDLLSALRGDAMPVRALVAAAGVFEITENNLRVTLARLLARGLIERHQPGWYRLARGAEPVQSHVATWTHLEQRLVPWRGGWIGVLAAGRARRRRRAFDFLGLRELEPRLWVRPDNLSGGVEDVRQRLYGLGMEAEVPVFSLTGLDGGRETRARGLWEVEESRQRYRQIWAAIGESRERLPSLPLQHAVAEAFLLGGRAIHLLVFDPLLPEEIDPGHERRAVLEAMRRYDALGRCFWSRFMLECGGPEISSMLSYAATAAGGEPAALAGAS
jgi:phenylacetic acid degradation operon negative regulatory protein